MPRSPEAAVGYALNRASFETGMCLRFVRTCFDVGPRSEAAADAWIDAERKHRGDTSPPPGVPMWWTGGARGFGHVAISLGGGRFRSTDVPSAGRVGNQSLATFDWPHRYVGWSEDINGVRVWSPPTPEMEFEMTLEQLDAFAKKIARETVVAINASDEHVDQIRRGAHESHIGGNESKPSYTTVLWDRLDAIAADVRALKGKL